MELCKMMIDTHIQTRLRSILLMFGGSLLHHRHCCVQCLTVDREECTMLHGGWDNKSVFLGKPLITQASSASELTHLALKGLPACPNSQESI